MTVIRWTKKERQRVAEEALQYLPQYQPDSKSGFDAAWLANQAQRVLPPLRQHRRMGSACASRLLTNVVLPLAIERDVAFAMPKRESLRRKLAPLLKGRQTQQGNGAATHDDVPLDRVIVDDRDVLQRELAQLKAEREALQSERDALLHRGEPVDLRGMDGPVNDLQERLIDLLSEVAIQVLSNTLRNEEVCNAIRATMSDEPRYRKHDPEAFLYEKRQGKELMVVIAGNQPRLAEELKRDPEFAALDIRGWTVDEPKDALKTYARKADVVISTRFVRHSHTHAIQSIMRQRPKYNGGFPRFIWVDGTGGTIKQHLRTLLPQPAAAQPTEEQGTHENTD